VLKVGVNGQSLEVKIACKPCVQVEWQT
jgi:hypothetical protein